MGLVVGLVVGAGAFHAGSRGTAAETKEEAVQLDYSAYHASLNGSTTAQALVPVRIHYRGEPGLNQREPLLPPACPIPVGSSFSSSSSPSSSPPSSIALPRLPSTRDS